MKKILKYVFIIGAITAISVAVYSFYLVKQNWWNDLWKKKGGSYTAIQIVKDFQANEDSAMKKYTDETNKKLVTVDGTVKEIKMENGKPNVYLTSGDSTTSVYFVLRDTMVNFKTGDNITIQGICTGFLGDVQFNDGVVIKK